jgi:hypothetical protein
VAERQVDAPASRDKIVASPSHIGEPANIQGESDKSDFVVEPTHRTRDCRERRQ